MSCADNVKTELIEYLEKQKDSGKTVTQEDVAIAIGLRGKSGYQRFRNCLSGRCDFNIEEIASLADLFGVSTDKLIIGCKKENRVLALQLGLSDESIQYLQEINNDMVTDLISIDMAQDSKTDWSTVPDDEPFLAGCSGQEMIRVINWLLSHSSGHRLLEYISAFCFLNTSHGWLYESNADIDDPFPFNECNEIYFRNRIDDGWKSVNPGILRYALIPAISKQVNKIRDEMMKGENSNGKKKGRNEKTRK